MLSKEIIHDRALRMGIATGDMPEVDFIWAVQKSEGNQSCFGQSSGCLSLNCRWRNNCVALEFYEANVVSGAKFRLVTPQDPPHRKAG
jgi:hypothetical protein